MKKIVILVTAIFLGIVILWFLLFSKKQENILPIPIIDIPSTVKEIKPSQTFTEYSDPSGFKFSYPDDLSISKSDSENPNVYTDLNLYSNKASGSLNLKITDSKYSSLDEWLKANELSKSTPADKKLGNLKALEVKTKDRLLLASLDQGILFTIEIPLIEESFWGQVYEKVISKFSFISPNEATQATAASSDEVVFEGEEVVE